jgi:uncharacterized protein with FMN-binding domain
VIFGIIAAVLLVLLLIKFIARKLRLTKLERLMKNLHKPVGIIILAVAVIHMLVTSDVWDTRATAVVTTGIATAVMLLVMALGYAFRKRLDKLWRKTHRYGAVITLVLLLCHIATYNIDFIQYQKNIAAIKVLGMDASKLQDGSYEGEYDAGYIYAKVRVKVKEGRMEDITILQHDNERGKPAETILQDIIVQQNTNVDAVSGATNSSLVLKKAVEQALQNQK